MDCPVCERRGDCRLQDLIYEYGIPEDPLPFERITAARDVKSRVIVRDPEKCIICGKCVRICDEIQGVAAIGIVDRGLRARVSTPRERPLDCEFCGQCVNACPYVPGRALWNHEEGVAMKCDLCADTPYWRETGGPGGKQACVAVCPFDAIAFTDKTPTQMGNVGYKVRLEP